MKQKLYNLLYQWEVLETCDFCQHIETFSDDNGRHPCNRCEYYNKFKLSKNIDADLKDKVKEIIEIVRKEKYKEVSTDTPMSEASAWMETARRMNEIAQECP